MTIMTLAQIVAQGVLPDLAPHATPIADAAAVFLGSAGALLVGAGSVVSMTGNNAGQVLSGSRMLFALAEHGELPAFFARIHPRFRTPSNAVIFTSVVAVLLALSGSWAKLAVVSALSRLVTYAGVSAATLRLRAPRFRGTVPSATFVAPFGPIVPIVAIADVAWNCSRRDARANDRRVRGAGRRRCAVLDPLRAEGQGRLVAQPFRARCKINGGLS